MAKSVSEEEPPTQLTVGVVGRDGDTLAEGLERQSPDLTVERRESVPENAGILSFDCLVVDGTGGMDHHRMYDHVRERHETVPLVVVSDGSNPALPVKLDSDENAIRVGPTESGIPYALLSSRCKDLADHVLIGEDDDESGPAYEVRAWEFYVLWGLAAATYGVGDMLSTLAALSVYGLSEGNPLVSWILGQAGVQGFVLAKFVSFFVAIGISVSGASADDRVTYYAPPLLVTAAGLGLTLWNLSLILG